MASPHNRGRGPQGETVMLEFKPTRIAGAGAKQEAILKKQFRYDPKLNTVNLSIGRPYEIDLDRVTTHQDVLSWVHHLSEKTWMTTVHVHYLIEFICKIKGWRIYR